MFKLKFYLLELALCILPLNRPVAGLGLLELVCRLVSLKFPFLARTFTLVGGVIHCIFADNSHLAVGIVTVLGEVNVFEGALAISSRCISLSFLLFEYI